MTEFGVSRSIVSSKPITNLRGAVLSAAELRRMMDELPAGLLGLRDRALLLLGFAGAFRRAELVALQCVALKFVSEGLEVLVDRSKTDQEQKAS